MIFIPNGFSEFKAGSLAAISDRLHMLVAPEFVQTLRELRWDNHSFIDDVAVFEA